MAHEIENKDAVVLRGKKAWHGLGTIIDKDMGAFEAYREFWKVDPVEAWPLAAFNPEKAESFKVLRDALLRGDLETAKAAMETYEESMVSVATHRANVRSGDSGNDLMGVVGASYKIVSDADLARFTDAISESGEVTVETCGTLRNGKLVWFLARGESFDMGEGDEVIPYICVSNAHDGSNSLRVTPTTTRVVCANTLSMCLGAAGGTEVGNSAIVIQHTGDMETKLVEATRAIRHYRKALRDTKAQFEKLRDTPVDRKTAMNLFASQYSRYWEVADETDLRHEDSAVRKLAKRRIERMESASRDFMTRFETESNQFGSANLWIAMNAFTGYTQHDRKFAGADDEARAEAKVKSNLFDANAKRSFETFESAIALTA